MKKEKTISNAPKKKVTPTKNIPFVKKSKAKKEKVTVEYKVNKPEFVGFTITAVIPTQQYGNIQPAIHVTAPSYEEAKAFVAPMIEDLYNTYAESLPKFMRESVTVTERTVPAETIKETPKTDTVKEDMAKNAAPVANIYTPPKNNDVVAGQPKDSKEVPFGPSVKSEAYIKAEKAIESAQTIEALDLIQGQINKSVKIDGKDKPFLDTILLKKKHVVTKQ